MRNADRLDENAASIEVSLDDDDLRRIDESFPNGVAAGTRYQKAGMAFVNR